MNKPLLKDMISRRIIACITAVTLMLSMIPLGSIAFASASKTAEASASSTTQGVEAPANGQGTNQPSGEDSAPAAGDGSEGLKDTSAGTDEGPTSTEGSLGNGHGQEAIDVDGIMNPNEEGEGEVEAQALENAVAQIGEDAYETLPAAIEAASDGDTITLLADVTVDETYTSNASLEIRKGLTIDGQGHTIACAKKFGIRIFGGPEGAEAMKVTLKDVNVTNANVLGRAVETRGGNVELVLDRATLTTTGGGNTQVFTVGGNRSNATSVTIKNGSKLIASRAGYGILTFNPVNMTIDNSEVSGYGALYFKGPDSSAGSAGSAVNIVNGSHISSTGIAGSSNTFGTLVFQEKGITVNVKDSSLVATADPSNNPATPQAVILYSSYANPTGVVINISGNSHVTTVNESAVFVRGEEAGNAISITGGTFRDANGKPLDVSKYLSEGLKLNDNGEVVEAYVAQVGEAKYETLQAAIDAAQDGDIVTLLADETTNKVIAVNKSIAIEGNGRVVSSTASRILWIAQNDVTVTLDGINFESTTAERGVQVNVGVTGVTLNISGCKIPATYYAVNMCSGTNVALNIDNCDIRGWGALNLWGSAYEVKVSNSTLVGHNDKGYNAEGWNGFGTVVLEGDTTGKTDEHVSGCHVVLDNCRIVASTAVNADGNANRQRPILFNSQSANNVVEITGASTVVEYTQGELTPFCAQNGSDNMLTVYGGTFSTDVSEYCAEGFETVLDANGSYVIKKEESQNPSTPGDGNQGNQQPSNPGTSNPGTATNPGTTNQGTSNASQGGNARPVIINRTTTLRSAAPAAVASDQSAEAIADDATPLASNGRTDSEDIKGDRTPMASSAQGQTESDQAGLIDWSIVALCISGLALLCSLTFFLLARKRRKDEEEAA